MPYRLTQPHQPLGDNDAPGYAAYDGDADEPKKGPTPALNPNAEGYAGTYGQHDFVGSARRSVRRSDQRYRDSARDPDAAKGQD